ncbi:MAG: hypothetical protein GY953_33030, partial [bacterium]|nr:hypothetical protein [bacterium]
MRFCRHLSWLLLLLLVAGCGAPAKQEFWIYTSVYKDVYPFYEPGLTAAFPDVDFKWYQSGSEKIAARIMAEEKGGGTKADPDGSARKQMEHAGLQAAAALLGCRCQLERALHHARDLFDRTGLLVA